MGEKMTFTTEYGLKITVTTPKISEGGYGWQSSLLLGPTFDLTLDLDQPSLFTLNISLEEVIRQARARALVVNKESATSFIVIIRELAVLYHGRMRLATFSNSNEYRRFKNRVEDAAKELAEDSSEFGRWSRTLPSKE